MEYANEAAPFLFVQLTQKCYGVSTSRLFLPLLFSIMKVSVQYHCNVIREYSIINLDKALTLLILQMIKAAHILNSVKKIILR